MSDFVAGKCGRLFPVYGIGCGQNRWCGPGAACPHCKKILELEEGKKNAETRKRIAERQVIELKEGIRGRDEEVIPDIESERDSKEAYIIELEADLAALREENEEQVNVIEGLRMDVASEGAVLAMTVARLGGLVEGRPTLRLNFLQRVDELVKIEAEALRE